MAPVGATASMRGGLAWDPEALAYVFTADHARYRVVLGPDDERSGLLHIEGQVEGHAGESPWQPLVREAGMLLREGEGAVQPPGVTHARSELLELRHSARGRILDLKYTERFEEERLRRTVQVRLVGGTLEIRVSAPGGRAGAGYCGFALGEVGPEESRKVLVPGLPDPLLVLKPNGFLCGYPDRYLGSASSYPPGGAFYRPDTEGVSRPVAETFYLTLSPDPLAPLPGLARPPAPHRAALESRITLDFFSSAPYAEDDRLLRLLPFYGMGDVLLIYRDWQAFGYERRGPLLYPANEERGENETFRRMLARAMEAGWLVALREEFATISQDSPYWSDKAPAQWWDGLPRLSRRPHQYGIAADRMIEFARLEATKIDRNYRPSAVFVHGHTAWNPEGGFRQVDSSPNSPAGTEADAIRHTGALLSFLREIHEGPVVGSGGEGSIRFDTFAEGLAEAVIRGPDGGRNAPLIVDYELRVVRPHLLGLGAGTYPQFAGYPAREPQDPGRIDWDAYRATEIALAHAGYLGTYGLRPDPHGGTFPGGSAANAMREYYLLRALQELYLNAAVRSIQYLHGEEMVGLAEALREGLDLSQARLRIEYGNGLTVWVNRSGRERWTVGPEDGRYELPPGGFLALAPRQKLVAYSALISGNHADFCRNAHYTFLDTRSQHPRRVEEISVDGAVALLKSAVHGRHDVVLVGAKQLTLGEEEYRISERGDLRLTHLSTREVELMVMDTDSGKPVHITWPAVTAAWKGPKIEVAEWTDGAWRASKCPVHQTRSGPQLGRALPGVLYRVSVPG
jgi:hypothetical protein